MSHLIESRPWSAIRWIHRRLRFGVSQILDRALGVHTSFVESTALFGTDDPYVCNQKPTGWLTLYRVFRALDIGSEDVMVDFGSGSGRAVLFASLAGDEGSCVLVSVRDSGPGPTPESFDHLFDAFYTTKPGGMGMGLSICRSIIEAHGGRIWAILNTGPGITVQLTLPISEAAVSVMDTP
jgi:Histidine kinase-, DNA gyrase B-, and HSP90-like ATPase